MEWGGRRLFERGFWKGAEGQHVELEVLDTNEEPEGLTDGIIEDEVDERVDPGESKNSKRWTRIARASGIIAKTVPGFKWEAGTRSFEVTGLLEQKVGSWREEERMEREEEERRRRGDGGHDDGTRTNPERRAPAGGQRGPAPAHCPPDSGTWFDSWPTRLVRSERSVQFA